MHRSRHIGAQPHTQLIIYFRTDNQAVSLAIGKGQRVFALMHQRVKTCHRSIYAVDTPQGDNNLSFTIGQPSCLTNNLRGGLDAINPFKVDIGHVKRLTLGRLDNQFWVKSTEKALGQFADAVIHRQHNNECSCADQQPNKRNPRYGMYDRLLPACKKVTYSDEPFKLHCFSSRSMFSI